MPITLSKNRILWGAPLAATLCLVLLGWWSNQALQSTLENKLRADLQTTLNANVTALEIWMNTQLRLASVLAGDPSIRPLILVLGPQASQTPEDRKTLGALPEQRALQQALDSRIQASGFGAVQVMSTNLHIIGGSARERSRLGTSVETEHADAVREVLTNGRPVLLTAFKAGFGRPPGGGRGRDRFRRGDGSTPEGSGPPPPFPPRPAPDGFRPEGLRSPGFIERNAPPVRPDFNLMEVVVPLKNDAGAIIAALGFILRPDEEFTKVLSVARPGDTGETIAFDPSGRLISESRFTAQLQQLGLLTNTSGISSSLKVELRDPGGDLTHGFTRRLGPTGVGTDPLMSMVATAIAGHSGVSVKPVRDYGGYPWWARGNGCPNTTSESSPNWTPRRRSNLFGYCA